MRVLHTSDWHLGKLIDGGTSRLAEQSEFIDELVGLAGQADLVIVAGDIYDVYNPPAAAEALFYSAMSRLGDGGRRAVIVIAGNHDNPDRLTAAMPLANEHGVILLGVPSAAAVTGEFKGFSITAAGPGYLELEINGESAVILTMPYPSEKRLNEVFNTTDEREFKEHYSRRIARLFGELSQRFRPDTVNIVTGHFYITGGEGSASERDIQLGGVYAVDSSALPANAQYIAMGHLHRPQTVAGVHYSGSPLQYSKSEIGMAKSVYLANIHPGAAAEVEQVYLRNYKPMEQLTANGVDEALRLCAEHADESCWLYLQILTDRPLLQSEIKQLYRLKPDIVEIVPVLTGAAAAAPTSAAEKSVTEEFADFYTLRRGLAPTQETVELFLELLNEDVANGADA